jgi:hypothetical protein
MAFRQPLQQRRQMQRPASIPHSLAAFDDATHQGRVDESQEWILFSPQLEHEPSWTSYTSQTSHIQQAPAYSDFASLETGDRSNQRQTDDDGEVTCQGTEIDEDDDEELDSLDDGLHTFHPSFSLDQSGGAVLPNHDGMGSFPALYHNNDNVQEHIWQFERYNPSNRRRTQRRRSSVQRKFDALEEQETDKQDERRLRVERWRLEQSRAVLEEIEKETRRRKKRLSIASRAASTAVSTADTETESFWQRVTRRVIKDLMGLDDTTLSVIFGEELAPAAQTTPTQQSPLTDALSAHQDRGWENRLLNRIAKELGILASQLAENDRQDRTFSTPWMSLNPTFPFSPLLSHIPLSHLLLKQTLLYGVSQNNLKYRPKDRHYHKTKTRKPSIGSVTWILELCSDIFAAASHHVRHHHLLLNHNRNHNNHHEAFCQRTGPLRVMPLSQLLL